MEQGSLTSVFVFVCVCVCWVWGGGGGGGLGLRKLGRIQDRRWEEG